MKKDPTSINPPLAAGVYRHYKGNLYQVLGTGTHSETLEKMVIYQALYGAEAIWVRPEAMFRDTVMVGGEPVMRFQPENAATDATSVDGKLPA